MIDRKRQLEDAIFRAHQRVWQPILAPSPEVWSQDTAGGDGDGDGDASPGHDAWPPGEHIPEETLPKRGRPRPWQMAGAAHSAQPFATDLPKPSVPTTPTANTDGKFPSVATLPPCSQPKGVTGALLFPNGITPSGRTQPTTWYLGPQKRYHGKDASIAAFDPSDPLTTGMHNGSDLTGDGSKKKPFASLNRLLYPHGVEPNTNKTWKNSDGKILLIPGDTIIMLNGIYDLHVPLPAKLLTPNGQPNEPERYTIAVAPLQDAPQGPPAQHAPPENADCAAILAHKRAKTILYEPVATPRYQFATIGPYAAHFGKRNAIITLRAETPGKVIIWGGDPRKSPLQRVPTVGSRGFALASHSYAVEADSKGALKPLPTRKKRGKDSPAVYPKLPAMAPGYWHFEGLTFRDMRECFTELAGASPASSYLGWHHVTIKDCRFVDGPNESAVSTMVAGRTTLVPNQGAWRANLTDPYGTPVTNSKGELVSFTSNAIGERQAANKLFKRWGLAEVHAENSTSKLAKGPCIILLVIDRNGNPYLDRDDRGGFSTIRSSLTSSGWLLKDCTFDRVAGLADNWFQTKQASYPFSKLGYEVGPLPGDAPPGVGPDGKTPNYVLGACIFGQIVPLLSPEGKLVPTKDAFNVALPNRDWLDHWHVHTHGYYAQGYGHKVEGCRFGNIGLGFCIKVAGHRKALVRPSLSLYQNTEPSHVISGCTFSSTAARRGADEKGQIGFYTSLSIRVPEVDDSGNPIKDKAGKVKKVAANRLPHYVSIENSVFRGPPEDVVVPYVHWQIGEGLTFRNCETTAPFWTHNEWTVPMRTLVGGEWLLVTQNVPRKGGGVMTIIKQGHAQAWDTPWRVTEVNPIFEPRPSATYTLKNISASDKLAAVYVNSSAKEPMTDTTTGNRIFTFNNKVRQG